MKLKVCQCFTGWPRSQRILVGCENLKECWKVWPLFVVSFRLFFVGSDWFQKQTCTIKHINVASVADRGRPHLKTARTSIILCTRYDPCIRDEIKGNDVVVVYCIQCVGLQSLLVCKTHGKNRGAQKLVHGDT